MIYIAMPYGVKEGTDPTAARILTEYRERMFLKASAMFLDHGEAIISPMALVPCFVYKPNVPKDWAYWQNYSHKLLSIATRVAVLKLDGWNRSTGVAGEIAEAERLGLPIEYIDPNLIDDWVDSPR